MDRGKYLAKRMKPESIPIRAVIITISDRSARGERMDASGPALAAAAVDAGWQVVNTSIIADDYELIVETLLKWSGENKADLILTTGGTGLSPRDVTPQATLAVIEHLVPGIAEVMRATSVKINPHAMLSRAIAGIRKSTLIINLPGSPKAAVENLAAIHMVIPHAIQLIRGDANAEASHVPGK